MILDAWLLRLDRSDEELAMLVPLLDAGEIVRADALRQPRDRARFIARRAQLRLLLSIRLDRPAHEVRFTANAFGKPALRDGGGWHFNVSHSGALGLCVIGRDAVGCDIERRRPALADPGTAARFFTAGEVRALAALPAARRVEGFFNCWTRKEAYVKALGLGLSCPLDSFAVTLAPGEPAALLGADAGWALHAFTPAPDHHAAIVARGRTARAAARWFAPFGRTAIVAQPRHPPEQAERAWVSR